LIAPIGGRGPACLLVLILPHSFSVVNLVVPPMTRRFLVNRHSRLCLFLRSIQFGVLQRPAVSTGTPSSAAPDRANGTPSSRFQRKSRRPDRADVHSYPVVKDLQTEPGVLPIQAVQGSFGPLNQRLRILRSVRGV